MDDSVKDPKSDSTPGSQGIGGSFVGRTGIIALAAYLVVLSALMFYILIKIWPRSTPSGSPAASPTKTIHTGTSALAPSATFPGSETNEHYAERAAHPNITFLGLVESLALERDSITSHRHSCRSLRQFAPRDPFLLLVCGQPVPEVELGHGIPTIAIRWCYLSYVVLLRSSRRVFLIPIHG